MWGQSLTPGRWHERVPNARMVLSCRVEIHVYAAKDQVFRTVDRGVNDVKRRLKMNQSSKHDLIADRPCPRWTWCVMGIWLAVSAVVIFDWQVEDVIAGTVCTNPASAQWEIFK